MSLNSTHWCRAVMFGSKVVHIGPEFSDQISVHFGWPSRTKMYWNLIWKIMDLSHLGPICPTLTSSDCKFYRGLDMGAPYTAAGSYFLLAEPGRGPELTFLAGSEWRWRIRDLATELSPLTAPDWHQMGQIWDFLRSGMSDLATNETNQGYFQIRFQNAKMFWNWSEKVLDLTHLEQSDPL